MTRVGTPASIFHITMPTVTREGGSSMASVFVSFIFPIRCSLEGDLRWNRPLSAKKIDGLCLHRYMGKGD